MPEPLPGESDASLVARSRRGDRDAFAELVRRWQRPLFSRALRSARNVPDADDLVQETFLRAWQGLKKFRDDELFGAWVLRILANLAADRARVKGREALVSEEQAAALTDPSPSPEQQLLAAELETMVKNALEQLPEGRQKEVFRMRFVDGRTIQDIARDLDLHTGTVKVHLFRLGRGLRRRITEGRSRP